MPVDVFDSKRHHIGLGPIEGGTLYGFSIAGYSKQGQRYGGSQDYGGTNDLIGTPNLSRWTQDDFSGGDGQYVWGKDPAMFASCHGILPAQFGNGLRTAPPVVKIADNFAETGQDHVPLGSFTYSGYLFTVFSNGVVRLDLHTGSTIFLNAVAPSPDNDIITGFAFDASRKQVYFSWHVDPASNGVECRKLPDLISPGTTATGLLGGPTVGDKNAGLGLVGDQLILARDRVLYSLTIPDNSNALALTDADWKKVVNGRLPGTWVDSCVYNNFVYILCSDPDDGTTLVYYDPGLDTVFTVCRIPYHFVGASICEYGGRIYVGGAGRDLNGDDAYAELYEVTGTSVRLVRTYAPESKATAVSHPWNIWSMAVCEGLLFFGNKGKCLSVYDIATDSFYDGPGLVEPSGVQEFLNLHAARGLVYAYLWHPLDASKSGYYRIAVGDDQIAAFTSSVVSSEFAPEPDRQKRWTTLKVLSRFGGVTAGYSFVGGAPGGDTFIALPQLEQRIMGDNVLTTFDLSDLEPNENIRLRFQMTRQNASAFTELVGFTLAFVMLDTGKRAWSFQVNATQYVEARDRSRVVQNVHDIQSELWRYWRERLPLNFTDVDGSTYKVCVTDVTESRPIIAGPVDLHPESGAESLIGLQLVEV